MLAASLGTSAAPGSLDAAGDIRREGEGYMTTGTRAHTVMRYLKTEKKTATTSQGPEPFVSILCLLKGQQKVAQGRDSDQLLRSFAVAHLTQIMTPVMP